MSHLRYILSGCCLALLFGPPGSLAQQDTLQPEDIERLQRETHFSSNWSDTRQFDLDNPIELEVTLLGFRVPPLAGAARVLFRLDLSDEALDNGHFTRDQVFRATVQTAGAFRRLRLDERRFRGGRRAMLRGWPPTGDNVTSSVMLVDEIELLRSGRVIRFHRAYPKMKRKQRS